MAKYSIFERKIAFFFTKFPHLKSIIKKTYQIINYLFYKKKYKVKTDFLLKELSYKDEESFFGYYDKSPINASKTHIIFHSTSFTTKDDPSPDKNISIILYDIKQDKYKKIDITYSYNWQQGAKLMWLNDYQFIYNCFNKTTKNYFSKIYDIKTKEFIVIDSTIYDATDTFGITLNFERLNIGRGDYAYTNLNADIDWSENKDGLFYVDIKNNNTRLLISLEKVMKLNYKVSMNEAKHKFNHIMISPNKDKIMFMHRWFSKSGQRFDTLYVSKINGSDLIKVSDDDMVSHCCWKNDNEIIGYMRDKDLGDNFYTINLKTNKKELINKSILGEYGDGHPSYVNNQILFDTYPDKSRMKKLFIYELEKNKLIEIGDFFESLSFYNETRCDLHPRFNSDGKMCFIDSVHTGVRKLYYFSIK